MAQPNKKFTDMHALQTKLTTLRTSKEEPNEILHTLIMQKKDN